MALASPFTDGAAVTFGVPDSPLNTAIIESVTFTKNSKVVRLYDANGIPAGKTVTVDFGEYAAKIQLSSVTGPTINIGSLLNVVNGTHSVMVTKASAAYTQGGYAYQSVDAIDQVNSVTT